MATLRGKKTEPAKKENKAEKFEKEEKFEVVVNELPELKAQVFEEVVDEEELTQEDMDMDKFDMTVHSEVNPPVEEVSEEKPKRTVADLNVSEMRMYQRTGFIPE